MAICGILGDSIALGIALAHPGCDVSAKVGRSTHAILAHQLPKKHYDYVVLSAGSNNPNDRALRDQLERIRASVDADNGTHPRSYSALWKLVKAKLGL